MSFCKVAKLYPILDTAFFPKALSHRDLRMRDVIGQMLAIGVTLLQYRNKLGMRDDILADARLLRQAAPSGSCLLIMNDHPDLAVEAGFDGVHLGQEDLSVDEARKIIGAQAIVGLSTHNPEQLRIAELTSADYLAVGPVFSTTSKQNPDPVIGVAGVRRARELTSKPLVGIGGITLENCREVLDAGADSVAVISALFADPSGDSPSKIARDFFVKFR